MRFVSFGCVQPSVFGFGQTFGDECAVGHHLLRFLCVVVEIGAAEGSIVFCEFGCEFGDMAFGVLHYFLEWGEF